MSGSPAGTEPRTSASGEDIPPWPAQLALAISQGAAESDGVRRAHAELARLGGRVPFLVVHDWHARTVLPLLLEESEDAGPLEAVGELHARALTGERIAAASWSAALEPALRDVYRLAYPYGEAHATASANAHAYAVANDYGESEATEFAATYAELNTTANARSYAVANSLANARATALAYAEADERAYAETYPYARAHAYVLAHAGSGGEEAAAWVRLAEGLADSLTRV
ncbi:MULTISPECIES: SpcZ [unclassified Streptomyces]|uniref:SpcZ n=1 Tax=unclassified Streptomyces TaxID=2593676 RepID=UPI0038246279